MRTRRNARDTGAQAEDAAARFLVRNGHAILARNFATPYGELDIVSWERSRDTLAFVEVKYRVRDDFGRAIEAVGVAKQWRIIRAAQAYLKQHPKQCASYRFDVIAVAPDGGIVHVPDAFHLPTEF